MLILALLLMLVPVGIVSAENEIDYEAYRNNQDFLKEDQNDWVCVDHAVNYSRNNPEWGIVILSPSPRFSVQPHMTNYKIDGNMLLIHEAQVNVTYELEIVNETMTIPYYEDFPGVFSQLWEGATYFHFIPNETDVIRVYVTLQDNRDEFFDYENMDQDGVTNITTEPDDITEVVVIGSNANITHDNTSFLNDITNDDQEIESVDDKKSIEEPDSYTSKFIQFVKSFIGLLS